MPWQRTRVDLFMRMLMGRGVGGGSGVRFWLPRSAWDPAIRRSASPLGRGASGLAFPRGAWERGGSFHGGHDLLRRVSKIIRSNELDAAFAEDFFAFFDFSTFQADDQRDA